MSYEPLPPWRRERRVSIQQARRMQHQQPYSMPRGRVLPLPKQERSLELWTCSECSHRAIGKNRDGAPACSAHAYGSDLRAEARRIFRELL